VLKVGPSTSENSAYQGTSQDAAAGIDTWTSCAAPTDTPPDTMQPGTARSGTPRTEARFAAFVAVAIGLAADCATNLPRWMADRLFAINDDEAYWRGWQIIKLHGGFGHRYRDPRFDSLTACVTCKGTGIGAIELAGLSLPCGSCLGTGRLTAADREPYAQGQVS
jgi:hypothetical protein